MPWNDVSIVGQREEFVRLAGQRESNVRLLCRRFISPVYTPFRRERVGAGVQDFSSLSGWPAPCSP
jgi:hypothetical protein